MILNMPYVRGNVLWREGTFLDIETCSGERALSLILMRVIMIDTMGMCILIPIILIPGGFP